MVLDGENISTGAPKICPDCHERLKLQVVRSAAGYYVGTMCQCGPYSRESGYYPTFALADQALKEKDYTR